MFQNHLATIYIGSSTFCWKSIGSHLLLLDLIIWN